MTDFPVKNSEDIIQLIKERLPFLEVEFTISPPGVDETVIAVRLPNGTPYCIEVREMDEESFDG